MALAGPVGLAIVFIVAFVQSFCLVFLRHTFQSFLFLIGLSIALPIFYLGGEGLSLLEDRKLLLLFINIGLLFIFCFNWLFLEVLKFFKTKKTKDQKTLLDKDLPFWPLPDRGLSLEFAQKLKPAVNSLIKYFPGPKKDQNVKQSVSSAFVSPQKGLRELEQMKAFILTFIDCAIPIEPFKKEFVNLKELVSKALQSTESYWQNLENFNKKIEFPDSSFKVKGSALYLEKCFKCILINSFEALKEKNHPEIYIKAYSEKPWAVLEFKDNGHGIEPEDIKNLYKPLFSKRLSPLRGLGLTYVQKIIKAHQAVLEIKSKPKQETLVRLKFPLSQLYDPSVGLAQKSYQKVS